MAEITHRARACELVGARVYYQKKNKLQKLGRVHHVVFSPDSTHVVGYLIQLPDLAGIKKRADEFVGIGGLLLSDDEKSLIADTELMGKQSRSKIAYAWDECVMWLGMDVHTRSGEDLGFIQDATFDAQTGEVESYWVAPQGSSAQLLGLRPVLVEEVVGYQAGVMLVEDSASDGDFSGGAAAAAGEAVAKAQVAASDAVKSAGKAVNKGMFELGKMVGKAKRGWDDLTKDEDEELQLPAKDSEVLTSTEPQVKKPEAPVECEVEHYVVDDKPKAQSKQKQVSKSTSSQVAKSAGKQLGKMSKMFGSFADEFKKASK